MKKWRIMKVIIFFGAFIVLSGCVTTQNMIGTKYTKEVIPNSAIYVTQVWALANDNEFTVSGKLMFKGFIGANIPDFVEISLIDKRGEVIEKQKVAYFPRTISYRRKHRKARFKALFTQVPPSGSTIRVSIVS